MFQAELDAEIDTSSWQQGPVFDWLAEYGNIETTEMRRTFNCGVGMVVALGGDQVEEAIRVLHDQGEKAWQIGRIIAGTRGTRYV